MMGLDAVAAYTPPPKASVRILKITRGRPFSSGLVFIDGKYVAPPYVVERYGNVLRINGMQISHPVVEWAQFLKTQEKAEIVRTESVREEPAAPATVAPSPAVAVSANEDVDEVLDDLFGDAPDKSVPTAAATPSVSKPEPTVQVTTQVRLDGEFEMNERAQQLLRRINTARTGIDAALRRGGCFCFGSAYSRISGDKEMTSLIVNRLPAIMSRASDVDRFSDELYRAGLVFFPPGLIEELFAHREDYPRLQRRAKQLREQVELEKMGI